MVKRCVAAGCSSTHKDKVHLYGFPKDPSLRKQWADQVKRTRDKWEPTDHSTLCSKHFEQHCFENYGKLSESLKIGKVRALLKPGAIPILSYIFTFYIWVLHTHGAEEKGSHRYSVGAGKQYKCMSK